MCLLWLRGGERDRGADEGEGAALVVGGVGEHGDLDVGVVEADLVAGEGGQVIEQAAEAAQWGAVGGLVTGGFGLGGGGALCGGDWVVRFPRNRGGIDNRGRDARETEEVRPGVP